MKVRDKRGPRSDRGGASALARGYGTTGLTRAAVLAALASTAACSGVVEDDVPDVGTYAFDTGAKDPNVAEHGERYIVTLSDRSRGKWAVRSAGGKIAGELRGVRGVAAYMTPSAAAALESDPDVVDVELDPKRYPFSETVPYGISMVQGDRLGDAASSSTTVCIIDSGISLGHEDLPEAPQVTASPASGAGDPMTDGCGHGTHIAGTIAALENDLGVVGVSDGGLKIHVVKVFGDGCGWTYGSSLIAALDECLSDSGTDNVVVNMSLGGALKSQAEERAFRDAFATGRVLSVAAAGNNGTTSDSYPASYSSVISVGAVDSSGRVAGFSQRNAGVELAAPGVAVLSTMASTSALYDPTSTLTAGSVNTQPILMTGSPWASVTAPLVDCGLGQAPCTDAAGAICLIERGAVSFADKVLNCEAGGGVGAVIYNNVSGFLYGTLGGAETRIPSVGVTHVEGSVLLGVLGKSASLSVDSTPGYTAIHGTSMATPHVAGGAAVLWNHFPWLSARDVRTALGDGALDLGPLGRDDASGNGLLQVENSYHLLRGADGCTSDADCEDGNPCNGAETCSAGACVDGTTAPRGTSCSDDGDLCNGEEICNGKGACMSHKPLRCIGNQACEPELGCVELRACSPAGKVCSDGAECCSGVCTVGTKGRPHCG